MKTRVSSRGQLVLPAELRQKDGIKAGEQFDVQRIDRGEYRLVRMESPANQGLVDWLISCPAKGYFVPIESESTDAL
jgi:AbrB family looped-hinge helix DNA binding protein